jgi:hypothetical protein|tara:strand:+ start:497 stop:964 length:468 start_codon:yes stop_codon:yes gene_type:complete
MAISTGTSKTYSSPSTSTLETKQPKPSLWADKYIIDNLPPWIYSDNHPPTNIRDCKAKISAIEYTIIDIDLQVDIRQSECAMGSSRYKSSYDFEKWKCQALKAKQSQYYLLNAYKYWMILNSTQALDAPSKLDKLIELLIEDSPNFHEQAQALLD